VIDAAAAAVLFSQEVKLPDAKLTKELVVVEGYQSYWACSQSKTGYSGAFGLAVGSGGGGWRAVGGRRGCSEGKAGEGNPVQFWTSATCSSLQQHLPDA
jgi:hypothetical protein